MTPMRLGPKQELFAQLLPRLIDFAVHVGFTLKFAVRVGEVERSLTKAQENAAKNSGIKRSLHCDKLAVDLNLIHNGKLVEDAYGHAIIGAWWVQQHELCRWGGEWGDYNHYSLTHGGRK